MNHSNAQEGFKVVVVAPFGRDAESIVGTLRKQDYNANSYPDLHAVSATLNEDVGVFIVTEEALAPNSEALRAILAAQPSWSDIPFILLAARSRGAGGSSDVLRVRLADLTANAIVLERPLSIASLVSATASTMRARQKQFEMRDRLADLETGRQALAASERELRLVADTLPLLVGFVDRDFRYRFANEVFADWIYRKPDEIIGRTVAELVGEEVFRRREPDMRKALAGEIVRAEFPWPHADGRRREAEVRYVPRHLADGSVDGFYTFASDVTERKATEDDLSRRVAERTAELEAEMAARMKAEAAFRQSQKMEAVGQLTGGIAHDFNNMLTGVIGAMDIMKRRLAAGRIDELERFMDAAATSAQRAAALTARLLAFSRRQSLDAKPTDINALTRGIEELLRRSVNENVSLELALPDGLPLATTDANQLENALLNLVINARDAMPDGGKLTIETAVVDLDDGYAAARPDVAPGHYVVLAVSDTGVGIEPEVLEKVFDPFFSTKPTGQGTGLGLSMVYGFARQSGGQVRVHSRVGVGTTVKVYLPVADLDAVAAHAVKVEPIFDGDGQTVLLVEDDPLVRLLVREVLEELRYRTLEAADADAALPIINSDRRIDLMVSDVGLPGMSGRQLAEVARQHRPDLPVLFVTGYAENAAIRAGFLGTRMGMITKPFAIETLSAKIAEMMAV